MGSIIFSARARAIRPHTHVEYERHICARGTLVCTSTFHDINSRNEPSLYTRAFARSRVPRTHTHTRGVQSGALGAGPVRDDACICEKAAGRGGAEISVCRIDEQSSVRMCLEGGVWRCVCICA